jgi:hypothetical protein
MDALSDQFPGDVPLHANDGLDPECFCEHCEHALRDHIRIDTPEGPDYRCPTAADIAEITELEELAKLHQQQEVAEIYGRISAPVRSADGPEQDEPTPHTKYPPSADGEPIHKPAGQGIAATLDAPPKVEIAVLPPLTLSEWRDRDLPKPDFLLGEWLSTTSRVLISAATGLGKTNFGLALGIRIAADKDFLHWRARRKARVLYIDGEMSRRLLRQRLLDEEERISTSPGTFFALSHEDIENFQPLNTPEGQAWFKAFIKGIGGIDLVIFDNVMSLTAGDPKDPEAWQKTIPLVHALTRASIGQIWIHHTGHDETRSYGDKTREWQMDTVAHFDAVKRDDTDISFSMSFRKARERTPATRFDFQDVRIALVNDRWEHEVTESIRPALVPPVALKYLQALTNVIASDQAVTLPGGRRAAKRDPWQAECVLLGLIDPTAKPDSARALFSKNRAALVAANRIACEGDFSWLIV